MTTVTTRRLDFSKKWKAQVPKKITICGLWNANELQQCTTRSDEFMSELMERIYWEIQDILISNLRTIRSIDVSFFTASQSLLTFSVEIVSGHIEVFLGGSDLDLIWENTNIVGKEKKSLHKPITSGFDKSYRSSYESVAVLAMSSTYDAILLSYGWSYRGTLVKPTQSLMSSPFSGSPESQLVY